MNAAAKLAIVPDDAAVLLDLLAPGEPVTFQTFDDNKDRKDRRLTHILHGSLVRHRQTLAELNARGAGIFWMVNAGDLTGRKARNVQRIRALFVDLDGAPLEPVKASPLAPHAIVESSPGRWHAYWRVSDCPLAVFPAYQKALAARFNSDPQVCGLPNVLRLPGFLHRKRKPFLSHIVVRYEAPPYPFTTFRDAFGSLPPAALHRDTETQEAQETQEIQVRRGGKGGIGARREKAKTSLAPFIPPTVGQRNRCLFALARHLKATMPDATLAELRVIVKEWHALALPTIGTADFAESWGDFARAFEKVRLPEGALMAALLKDVDADPLPDGVPDDYEPRALRLVRICGRLQREAGNEPFYLSARTAGGLLDVHFTNAANLLCALVADGVLDRVNWGTWKDRRASEYRMPVCMKDSRKAR